MPNSPRLRFPHPFVILVAATLLAAALTWVLPASRARFTRLNPILPG